MRASRLAFALAVVLTVASAACGRDGDAPAHEVIVRDSAGVRIVESGRPTLPAGTWTVAAEPSLTVGVLEGDPFHALVRVVGALTLSDGRLVVAQSTAPMLRWYGPDGVFEVGAGRPGGGPGEYERSIDAIWRLEGDSVATWEHATRRMQLFGPNGVFARSVVLELPPDLPTGTSPQFVGASEAGFVTQVVPPRELGTVGLLQRPDHTYLVHAPDGTFVGRLGDFPGYQSLVVEFELPDRSETVRAQGRPPFAASAYAAVTGDRFYFGPTDRYEISIFALSGELESVVRKTLPDRPVTDELKTAWVADYRRRQGRSAPPVRPAPEDMPVPDELPAHWRIDVDAGGSLWVEDYPLPRDSLARWSVFDADGRWTTDVELPGEWEIQEIGAEHILVLATDELEVERVMRLELRR